MNSKAAATVKAFREGGGVSRCHTRFTLREYLVAQHSYNALSLLLQFHPDPSISLIKAVLWHDVPERWLGDPPSPVKWRNPELAAAYKREEKNILLLLGVNVYLTDTDQMWLKAVDCLDLWLWSREEESLGNRHVSTMRRDSEGFIQELVSRRRMPAPLLGFFMKERDKPHEFLGDIIEDLERHLEEAI